MKKFFINIGDLISRRPKTSIIIILVMTLIFAFGLVKLQMQMGNEVFVSKSSEVYKNTKIYQKYFGGDSVYILLSGNKNDLISQNTAQEINTFMNKAVKIDNITGGTNYVNLLNAQLHNPNSTGSSLQINNKNLEKALMSSFTDKQQEQIQTKMENSLTSDQRNKVQAYMQSQLTTAQKQTLAVSAKQVTIKGQVMSASDQKKAVQKVLTKEQKNNIRNYTMNLLNNHQKNMLKKQMISYLPDVQNMKDSLLRKIIFSDKGKVSSQLNMLIPKNGNNVLIVLNTSKNTDMDTYVKMKSDIDKLVRKSHFGSNIKIQTAGQPMVLGEVKTSVMKTMVVMLSIAFVLMMVILLAVFKVRRRLTSLGVVLMGLVWTFGIMGWFGIPITLATMATLPIIVGLGTDFGVQFHNRYEEEYKKSRNAHSALINAISNMGPAVGIAVFIMALSFLTMFLSKAPMMQQFGMTLALGVICCYIVDLVMIFSLFRLMDRKNKPVKELNVEGTGISRFLSNYAGFVGKFAIPVLIIGIALSAFGFSVEKSIPIETDIMKMIPQGMESLKNTKELQKNVGSTTYITYLVKAEDVRDPMVMNWMDQFGNEETKKYKDVQDVTSLPTILKDLNDEKLSAQKSGIKHQVDSLPEIVSSTLMSKNHHYATIQFKINKDLSSSEQLNLMNQITDDIDVKHGIEVHPAGAQVMMLNGIHNIGANRTLMIIAGLSIIFIGLVLVYRNVKYALYPLVPIILVLGFSPGTLKFLDMSYNPLTTALSSLVLGIGTEFTILIMERFREEEEKGYSAIEAVKTAVSNVGQAITASGLTVVGGFSTLIFVTFPILKAFGITTVIDTAYSLISALTILPALIILFRKRGAKKKSIRVKEVKN
ncbi:efflux RND transporter permease subunit [Heyndrickxia ginsengihumi]|uniref:efflux RND transporter permease subunit n=1 Tax=Heyndrickxia ginsengihumi TaxID=363870 RepID=UPI00203BCE2B|nr:hydrophobe/amphiphile efflux-3 (HAE3) family transporter [Heyndrickxia ginsengihumi]MCM3022580.1 hydrophobe/amphiphile efflux-3 (HAE3) family transporter [Heyndrickxia ginsengihumi]